ncbi:hypothetical protein [Streptomyces sp. NPDC047453]|uniref:hypothetical protein n=1 Tax=Streptomyces sp. NPDC047453 TaxID=3154812 RepID=UPI00340F1FEE
MTRLPRAGLGRVLEELGSTLLDVICGDAERAGDIGGVVIHDPLDEPELPDRALVLGVALHEPDDIARVLTQLGERGAVALVVRAPVVGRGAARLHARRLLDPPGGDAAHPHQRRPPGPGGGPDRVR